MLVTTRLRSGKPGTGPEIALPTVTSRRSAPPISSFACTSARCRAKWIRGSSTVDPHAPATEGHGGPAGAGDAAAVGELDVEEATVWCAPAWPTTTPARTADAAIPATAHTHRGGRGQPPNSTTSSDGIARPRPHRSSGGGRGRVRQSGSLRATTSATSPRLCAASVSPERVRDVRGPLVL